MVDFYQPMKKAPGHGDGAATLAMPIP